MSSDAANWARAKRQMIPVLSRSAQAWTARWHRQQSNPNAGFRAGELAADLMQVSEHFLDCLTQPHRAQQWFARNGRHSRPVDLSNPQSQRHLIRALDGMIGTHIVDNNVETAVRQAINLGMFIAEVALLGAMGKDASLSVRRRAELQEGGRRGNKRQRSDADAEWRQILEEASEIKKGNPKLSDRATARIIRNRRGCGNLETMRKKIAQLRVR